jgi:polysaccharide export outer membrane protein
MKKSILTFGAFALLMLASSCTSSRKIVYMQDSNDESTLNSLYNPDYELKIQPEDQLTILISCKSKDLLEPFSSRINVGSGTGTQGGGGSSTTNYFLVEKDGTIHFPVFGKIQAAGKTREQLAQDLKNMIIEKRYVLDPDVTVLISNFRVNVLGEVSSPGVKVSNSEKMTIYEALAMAGDLKITGLRKNVKVMRTIDGKVQTIVLDLTSQKKVLSSPAYYLRQNDVIYVEPNKAANVDANPSYRYMSAILAVVSFFSSIATLVIAFTK